MCLCGHLAFFELEPKKSKGQRFGRAAIFAKQPKKLHRSSITNGSKFRSSIWIFNLDLQPKTRRVSLEEKFCFKSWTEKKRNFKIKQLSGLNKKVAQLQKIKTEHSLERTRPDPIGCTLRGTFFPNENTVSRTGRGELLAAKWSADRAMTERWSS